MAQQRAEPQRDPAGRGADVQGAEGPGEAAPEAQQDRDAERRGVLAAGQSHRAPARLQQPQGRAQGRPLRPRAAPGLHALPQQDQPDRAPGLGHVQGHHGTVSSSF